MLATMPRKPKKPKIPKTDFFTIKVPRMYEAQLEELADRQHRDKTKQVVFLIEQALIKAGIVADPSADEHDDD